MIRSPHRASNQDGTLSALRRLLTDYVGRDWGLLALGILCMLAGSALSVGIPWLADTVVKQVFMRHQAELLLPLSLLALGILAMRGVSLFSGRVLIDSLGEKAAAKAQADMFTSLINRDLADLNAVHSGQFVSNFIYDATLMRDALTQGVAAIFLEFVSLLLYLAYVLVSDWQLGAIALLALPLVAWVMERLGGSMRRAATRGMTETGDLSVALAEAMDGRRIIKAYGLEAHSMERVQDRLSARLKTLLKAVKLRAAAAPMTDIFTGIVVSVVIYYAGWQILHGALTLNAFVGFLAALLLAQQPVRNLSQLWPIASSGIAAAHRIFAAIDTKPVIVDAPGAATLTVPSNGGKIIFDNVCFGYGDTAILDGVSLEIPAGGKVALVGPSGAGKTTIFNLLLRFYDCDGGRITIDGQDIHQVTLESLRASIGVVTQEAVLFDESIADNIALGQPGAGEAAIAQAAKDAAAQDFIAEAPEGYATRVGEGGLKLSGGQRQRIAIARAMLRNAPILLLDEATSALDTESERQVQEALTRLAAGRTTIVIAHRLSTVRDADCIFVLDKGQVVESGKHDELIARGGLYAQLYRHNLADTEAVS